MFEQSFKNFDDILWKEAGCTTELDYVEQTSWVLFLKYPDDLEKDKAMEAQLTGKPYRHIIEKPYRWENYSRTKTTYGPSGVVQTPVKNYLGDLPMRDSVVSSLMK